MQQRLVDVTVQAARVVHHVVAQLRRDAEGEVRRHVPRRREADGVVVLRLDVHAVLRLAVERHRGVQVRLPRARLRDAVGGLCKIIACETPTERLSDMTLSDMTRLPRGRERGAPPAETSR